MKALYSFPIVGRKNGSLITDPISLFSEMGRQFANYMMNIQNQASPDNINKNFEIYPKDLEVDMYAIAKMQPSLALIDIGEKEADPQNLGLLAMLCATSKNGFSVPKEIMERFDVDFRCMSLMVGMEEYKTQFYPHSTSKKLREVAGENAGIHGHSC